MPAKRKFAAFDIDGTLFRWQLFHEFVFALKDAGQLDAKTAGLIDDRFLAWTSRKISFGEYEATIVDALSACISNLSLAMLEEASSKVVKASGHKVYKFTRDYIKQLKDDGYFLLAITGSHQEIAQPFAEQYGFDDCIGVLFERNGDVFTGNYERYVYGRKGELITEYAKSHNLTFKDSVAVGDSKGDASMLEIVEKPLAFNPAHDFLEIAMEKGWKVVIERKDVAYELQKGQDGTYLLAQADQL
ncbi:MAG TPA: HAD-IB family phosphatase [Candidatus Saccharimonadales bacterium]|nr:HAD-IB family phosphatase [Candidatus Saccharimonadales bacterium]